MKFKVSKWHASVVNMCVNSGWHIVGLVCTSV